ncbi:MAG: phage/plasmid replication protein, II/X family [Marinagarivorans sp.]|nr:phage/plasmid replication protein, II/X family [Marinagarivorans sp.]
MNHQIALSTEIQHSLPLRLQGTYMLWRSGVDLRHSMPKTSFYRQRKELYAHGIDITLRQDCVDQSNVIPLVRVLEAKPASIPLWAFEQKLVHRSASM